MAARAGLVGAVNIYITLIRAVVPLRPNWSLCKMSRPTKPLRAEHHCGRHGAAHHGHRALTRCARCAARVCVVGGCGGRVGSPAVALVRRSAVAAPLPPPAVSVSLFVRSCLSSALPVRLLARCLVRRSATGAAAPPMRGV